MDEPKPVNGQFPKGISGNPVGRPKGSKNKITLLKMMVEQASRERNYDLAQQVIDDIYKEALQGDTACRKLVWSAHMSGNSADDTTTAQDKPTIVINAPAPVVVEKVIDNPPQEELANDSIDEESGHS